jgi:hypothetical protein
MGHVCSTDLFTALHRARINQVRKYKGVHSVGDFILGDSRTPDPFIIVLTCGLSPTIALPSTST